MKQVVDVRDESLKSGGILPGFVLYWISLAVAFWIGLIDWRTIVLYPLSIGLHKF
jgi:hypothetical protein